jgi:glyoxylate reductase
LEPLERIRTPRAMRRILCHFTLVNSLEELLQESDFVSLHGRLTERTHRMIGQRELGLMKPTAFFINVARGEMVDGGVKESAAFKA